MSNKSFQPTKPFVTRRASARPAPNAFAGEANVRQSEKRQGKGGNSQGLAGLTY